LCCNELCTIFIRVVVMLKSGKRHNAGRRRHWGGNVYPLEVARLTEELKKTLLDARSKKVLVGPNDHLRWPNKFFASKGLFSLHATFVLASQSR
jgi:hypothetical protein